MTGTTGLHDTARPADEDRKPAPPRGGASRRSWLLGGGVAVLLVAMALDTTVVPIDPEGDAAGGGFSPAAFGAAEFPRIRAAVETRAVPAAELAAAIAEDEAAAAERHGTPAGIGAVMPVRFTGIVGEGKSGVYDVAVEGLPEELRVRVQTGPAVNGTDLRDAPGDILFGQFTNQIEYQDAGSAINAELKRSVLEGLDTSALTGREISVTGVFKLVNPKSWLVTPVDLKLL